MLSLNLDVELASVKGLRAVSGVTQGQIGPGERVTWEVRQFGLSVRHTTEISGYEFPVYFQDRMAEGVFASFVHDHVFECVKDGSTVMRDVMRFGMRWYLGGVIAERLLVKPRMAKLLAARNATIKREAERG